MAYLSLLTARKVFKEIQVGFLMVGHTHEDIDAYFSYLSKKLKNVNTFVLPDLMKEFMTSQHLPFVPQLIQEVANFKAFIKDYHHDGASALKGIIEMHLFRFYDDDKGWPVMQYRKSSTDVDCCLRSIPLGCGNRMPTETPNCPLANPSLYNQIPYGVALFLLQPSIFDNSEKDTAKVEAAKERKSHILKGLQKYIDFWKTGMSRNETYARDMHGYVQY